MYTALMTLHDVMRTCKNNIQQYDLKLKLKLNLTRHENVTVLRAARMM